MKRIWCFVKLTIFFIYWRTDVGFCGYATLRMWYPGALQASLPAAWCCSGDSGPVVTAISVFSLRFHACWSSNLIIAGIPWSDHACCKRFDVERDPPGPFGCQILEVWNTSSASLRVFGVSQFAPRLPRTSRALQDFQGKAGHGEDRTCFQW